MLAELVVLFQDLGDRLLDGRPQGLRNDTFVELLLEVDVFKGGPAELLLAFSAGDQDDTLASKSRTATRILPGRA